MPESNFVAAAATMSFICSGTIVIHRVTPTSPTEGSGQSGCAPRAGPDPQGVDLALARAHPASDRLTAICPAASRDQFPGAA